MKPSSHSPSGSTRREFVLQAAGAISAVAILPELGFGRYMPAEPFTIGLIGAGRQGRAILGELGKIENVKVAGVCDIEDARREAGAKRVAGAEAFADYKAMLDKLKGLSAVIIATPTHLHKQIALDCIAAGKHVYCEAPLAHSVEDCRAIVAAAAPAKTVFAVGLEGRSNPVYRLARTFFRSDAVREFIAAEAQHYQKTSWRFPASDSSRDKIVNWRLDPEVSLGLAGELGVQQLDVVMWYTDLVPTSAWGAGAVRFHADGREVADTARCEYTFTNKTTLSYSASLANSYGGRFEVLRGSNAAVKLGWTHGWMFKEADAPTQGWEVYANRQQFHTDEGITLIADATKLAAQGKLKEGVGLPQPSLYYALEDFIKAASEGKKPACDVSAGARSTIIAIHGAQAVAKNQIVAIDAKTHQFS